MEPVFIHIPKENNHKNIIYVQYYQESDTYTAVYFEEHQSVSVVGDITKLEAVEVIKNLK